MWATNTLTLVETFIRRLHDGDIVVSTEASSIMYYTPSAPMPNVPLSEGLANSISAYEAHKLDLEHLLYYAGDCLSWINRVIARGLIREGSGLFSKMRVYEEEYGRLALENRQLKEGIDKLQKENDRLKKLNEELDKTLSRFGKAGNVGDVSGDEDE
jgi:hypothetical protein